MEEEEGEQKGQRPLGCLSESLGISLGRFLDMPLGSSWGSLGSPGGLLGVLGASGGPLGAAWGPLGGLLGASWGPLGSLLGPSWSHLGAILDNFGPSKAILSDFKTEKARR